MLTVLGLDRALFEPVVITGEAGSWDAQGGMGATHENVQKLEKGTIRCHVVPSLVRHISPWQDVLTLWTLIGILKQEHPEIVHTHTSKAGVLGRIAAWFARIPVIVHTPHGHVFYGHFGRLRSWMFLHIERWLARMTSWLIALTDAERQDHLERGVGRRERFAVIPSGIDLERFQKARKGGKHVPDWFGCPSDATVIGSVGWLTDIKGHRFLVEAVGALKADYPDLHLVIVGSGDQRDALLAQAERAGIRDALHLVGHREKIEACLAGMDYFVLPSLNEGMGRALIEAMAAGLPVIASRVGGIPALIEDGENGLLVPAGDSQALAEALRRMRRHPEWAGQLGSSAARSIGIHYGVEAMVRAVETVYREASVGMDRIMRCVAGKTKRSVGIVCLALAMCLVPTVVRANAETNTRVPLRVAIHVHSTASTGMLSLESLAKRAEQQGLDALILSENFTLRYDYGLRPLEGLLKHQVVFPSVLEYGIERFLDEVRAVQQRHPTLIIVPGVEVAPHYYWTGSLLGGDLTMHNAQRNLLVIGLDKVDDYVSLPARGNPLSFAWDEKCFANGLPLLLIVPAIWVWLPRKQQADAWEEPTRPLQRVVAAIVLVVCVGLAINAWPLTSPAFSSYDAHAGYQPYQALIDAATQRGALVFWSMTEARDFSQHSFGPLGVVTVKTEPHPEGLILTHGYSGFGGLYQDTRHVVAPGGIWDQVLQATVTQQPGSVPTMIGEVGFHGLQDAAKDLDRVYTVVQATERTSAGVLEALRSGHAYAVARGDDHILLQLNEFRVTTDRGARSAGIGDTLASTDRREVMIHVGISAMDQKPHPARLRIIRSGQVIGQIEGQTPFHYELADHEASSTEWVMYRLEVVGKSGELLTNPIYVAPIQGMKAVSGWPSAVSTGLFDQKLNAESDVVCV